MLKSLAIAMLLLCLGSSVPASGQEAGRASMSAEQFELSLSFQQGKISLPGGMATLDLPPTFRYLNPADTDKVLVEGWGNPPGRATLGMIVPTATSLLSAAGWGVIVTYDADGHVNDADADAIDYDELLKEMQGGVAAGNGERKEAGYPALALVGWAEKPSYDKASHKLYWAQELKTAGDQGNGLNYNIRVLGREGVLVLNAVASMDQLDKIRAEMKQVTAFSDFTPGNRYADFNSATDKTAEYGIAALVAGGAAAKMGLFGKLLVFVLAFKKLLLVGLGALGIGLARFFGRKSAAKVSLKK